eukprot:4968930-Pyramimonas_sp.AAC.1
MKAWVDIQCHRVVDRATEPLPYTAGRLNRARPVHRTLLMKASAPADLPLARSSETSVQYCPQVHN